MEGFQFGDILVLALIAGIILLKLRNTLGKSDSGIDRDEFIKKRMAEVQERMAQSPQKPVTDSLNDKKQQDDDALILSDIGEPSISAGLVAIKAADSSFSARHFLNGAKAAFEMVLEAFQKGDKIALKQLLSPSLLDHFANEIDKRSEGKRRIETTLVAVEANQIVEAGLSKNVASITVKFVSEQISVERNEAGEVIHGDPTRIEKVIDHWTFEREVKSNNPNWKLVDT